MKVTSQLVEGRTLAKVTFCICSAHNRPYLAGGDVMLGVNARKTPKRILSSLLLNVGKCLVCLQSTLPDNNLGGSLELLRDLKCSSMVPYFKQHL